LRDAGSPVKTIIVVELPRQRSFMHLDTVFTFTSRTECLIYPPVILPGGSQAASVTTIDLTKKGISYAPQKSLLDALKKRGFDLEPIYCGGRSAVDQQREQWTDGANAFAVAPGLILLYQRNHKTMAELAERGWRILPGEEVAAGKHDLLEGGPAVISLWSNELSRARGGPRCMTMPLERDPL
jgi:arginine deiminase